MVDFATRRAAMVEEQLRGRDVRDPRVLAAMGTVPREAFVPPGERGRAYLDTPLSIGHGQTISQPFIVAAMLEAADAGPDDRLLDVGAGSGYAAAVASLVVGTVHAIERLPELGEEAAARLARLGYGDVELRVADGALGWPEAAPFDVVLVAAAGPEVPPALRDQLAVGGRLVMPVGEAGGTQVLRRVTRTAEDRWASTDLGAVRFVPLIT